MSASHKWIWNLEHTHLFLIILRKNCGLKGTSLDVNEDKDY